MPMLAMGAVSGILPRFACSLLRVLTLLMLAILPCQLHGKDTSDRNQLFLADHTVIKPYRGLHEPSHIDIQPVFRVKQLANKK